MTPRPRAALLFFLYLFLLLSSGRIASSDAGQQLSVAMLLVSSGTLSDDGSPGGPATPGWVRAPNGRLYQAHDIGNVILMLPSAFIASRLYGGSAREGAANPPALARAGAAVSCSMLAAVGCFWLFRLFSLYWPPRAAFLLAAAFPFTTIFIAYARAAWDVLGASALMCGVLYYSASLPSASRPGRAAILTAATLAAVCSFRYSLAPFFVPATAVILFASRGRLSIAQMLGAAITFGALIVPTFLYNAIRTGSMFVPATAVPQYAAAGGPNALTGNALHGVYGLLVSPNRGLFVFCPVLLLAAGVLFLRDATSQAQRTVLIAFGAASAAYLLLIARIANWGAFGWGPRYLVPVLPIVFFAAACSAVRLWDRARAFVVALFVGSAVLNAPVAIINWHLALTTFPESLDSSAPWPYQHGAAWRMLSMGLSGREPAVPAESAADPLRATSGRFPDLLVARIAGVSRAGTVLAAGLLLAGVFLAWRLARDLTGRGPTAVRAYPQKRH